MKKEVILVDNKDREIGFEGKIETHQKGKLHRAFSIFVFNDKNELMLQKRAKEKYHSGGLWTNTCCSHPGPNEPIEEAAHRRLKKEMGFDCKLKKAFDFIYKIKFKNGLFEHEFDHVFIGKYNNPPVLNPKEAESWKWISLEELKKDIQKSPDDYTYWLKISLDKLGELQSLFSKKTKGRW